jgi:hypothetical protein
VGESVGDRWQLGDRLRRRLELGQGSRRQSQGRRMAGAAWRRGCSWRQLKRTTDFASISACGGWRIEDDHRVRHHVSDSRADATGGRNYGSVDGKSTRWEVVTRR